MTQILTVHEAVFCMGGCGAQVHLPGYYCSRCREELDALNLWHFEGSHRPGEPAPRVASAAELELQAVRWRQRDRWFGAAAIFMAIALWLWVLIPVVDYGWRLAFGGR